MNKKYLIAIALLLVGVLIDYYYYYLKLKQPVPFDRAELLDPTSIESVKSGCQGILWGPEEQNVKQKNYEECLQQYPNAR